MKRARKWKMQLDTPLVHLTEAMPIAFKNNWLHIALDRISDIRCLKIVVSQGYKWDGCTGAYDFAGTKWASCLHDALYQHAEAIAKANRMTVHQVLRWADHVFFQRMLDDGTCVAVAIGYYAGVSVVGYPYHVLRRWIRGPADGSRRGLINHGPSRQ